MGVNQITRSRIFEGTCPTSLLFFLALLLSAGLPRVSSAATKAYERREYTHIKRRLVRGWNTWNSRDVLEQVLLPEGLFVHFAFKSTTFGYLDSALLGPIPSSENTREQQW